MRALTSAATDCGFLIGRMVEPRPAESMAEQWPDAHEEYADREGFTPEELQQYGLQILNAGPVWTADGGAPRYPFDGSAGNAPLDTGFNASYGNTFGRLGLVVSGTRDSDFREVNQTQNFYRYSEGEPNDQYLADSYDFDRNVEKVTTGMVGNLAYRITDNHHLKFRSIFSTISAAETRLQEGYSNDFGGDLRDYKVEYRNQETRTFQLSGEHYLGLGKLGAAVAPPQVSMESGDVLLRTRDHVTSVDPKGKLNWIRRR